jgi:hypothetical protein
MHSVEFKNPRLFNFFFKKRHLSLLVAGQKKKKKKKKKTEKQPMTSWIPKGVRSGGRALRAILEVALSRPSAPIHLPAAFVSGVGGNRYQAR